MNNTEGAGTAAGAVRGAGHDRQGRADSLSGDIADRTAAYISEKAASLGIDCRVQVEVRTEDGLPLPYGASLDVERDQVLSDYMAQELGIPASRQSWQPEE